MSSDSITDPENVKHLRTELHSKQEMINKYRQDLLHQLRYYIIYVLFVLEIVDVRLHIHTKEDQIP